LVKNSSGAQKAANKKINTFFIQNYVLQHKFYNGEMIEPAIDFIFCMTVTHGLT